MEFTKKKKKKLQRVKKGSTYFMCMGTFQVSVRILIEDLGCYIRDIHKTGNDIDMGKTLKGLPWCNFITTLTCLINLDFGAIRDFI